MVLSVMQKTASSLAPLNAKLLSSLRTLRLQQRGRETMQNEQVFSYCVYQEERLRDITLPHPLFGIVLWGRKQIWFGNRSLEFEAGSVFVAPRNIPVTVVNIPDASVGRYETMILQVTKLPAALPPAPANREAMQTEFNVELSPDLFDAVTHAARSIHNKGAAAAVKQLRYAEVLSLLRPLANARCLFEVATSEHVAWVVRTDPARPWTAQCVATQLRMSTATLRRRLAGEGTSFRHILISQRMSAARHALQSGAISLEAAETAGYSSRSHFSRRYREQFGTSPTGR